MSTMLGIDLGKFKSVACACDTDTDAARSATINRVRERPAPARARQARPDHRVPPEAMHSPDRSCVCPGSGPRGPAPRTT